MRRFKVTIFYYNESKKVYRNQTNEEAKEWERQFLRNPTVIKNVRVENEPSLRIVKDGK